MSAVRGNWQFVYLRFAGPVRGLPIYLFSHNRLAAWAECVSIDLVEGPKACPPPSRSILGFPRRRENSYFRPPQFSVRARSGVAVIWRVPSPPRARAPSGLRRPRPARPAVREPELEEPICAGLVNLFYDRSRWKKKSGRGDEGGVPF